MNCSSYNVHKKDSNFATLMMNQSEFVLPLLMYLIDFSRIILILRVEGSSKREKEALLPKKRGGMRVRRREKTDRAWNGGRRQEGR